jgi:hypothetical protein
MYKICNGEYNDFLATRRSRYFGILVTGYFGAISVTVHLLIDTAHLFSNSPAWPGSRALSSPVCRIM